MSHARNGGFSSKCGCKGLLAPIGEDMLGANDDRRDAGFRGVPDRFGSTRSDELEDFRPRVRDGAGDEEPFRLPVLELRRRVWGRGEEGVCAFGSLGEAGPGEGSHRLLVLVCSERRLTERESEFGSLLLWRGPCRGVVSLPAPGDGGCWWPCIAAGSQRVAARLLSGRVNVLVGCFSSKREPGSNDDRRTLSKQGPTTPDNTSVHKAPCVSSRHAQTATFITVPCLRYDDVLCKF